MRIRRSLFFQGAALVLMMVLVACGSTSKRADSFGKKIVQRVQERQLPNGLTILYMRDETLPYVSLNLMLDSGSASDEDTKYGAAALTAELIDKGTRTRTATQIADQLGQMGTEFQRSVNSDFTLFSAQSLSAQSTDLLELFADLILNPSFQTEEFRRSQRRFVAQARQRVDNPSQFAGVAWDHFVFSGHPYSKVTYGSEASLGRIQQRDINKHYLVHYRPNRAYLAVVGQWPQGFERSIEAQFSEWQSLKTEEEKASTFHAIEGHRYRVIHQPGAVQAQIVVGHPTIPRAHPDHMALQVANSALGGAFQSRLMERIRKDLGLTYGVRSSVAAMPELGVFQVEMATKTETTAQSIDEIIGILKKAVDGGLTIEELEATKGYMRGVFPRTIELPESVAVRLLHLRRMGLSDEEVTGYLAQLNRLSLEQVNSALRRHINPDNLKILIYGDRGALQRQLGDRKVEWKSQSQAF